MAMGKRTSVYLTAADQARLEACGLPLPEVIRRGLNAALSMRVDVAPGCAVVNGRVFRSDLPAYVVLQDRAAADSEQP